MTVTGVITLRCSAMLSNPNLEDFIEYSDQLTGTEIAEPLRTVCVALRAMHYMAMQTQTATSNYSAGNTTSIKEGELAETFEFSSSDLLKRYPDLGTTCWGVELVSTLNGSIFCARNRNC